MENNYTNYFEGFYGSKHSKTIFLTISLNLMTVSSLLCYSIVWYERYGLDCKRTIINQLYALQWWTGIEFILMVTLPDWLRLIFGPWSELPCWWYVVVSIGVFAKLLFLQTGLIMTRYAWIFWLKNPLGFKDDFWCCFINIWSNLFCFWPQLAFAFLPGRQPVGYYICTGQDPSKNSVLPEKSNYTLPIIGYGSVIAHIFISVKIFLHKRKINPNEGRLGQSNLLHSAVQKENLSGFITITSSLALTVVFGFLFSKFSSIEPKNYNFFPEYLLVYWIQLINAPVTLSLLAIVCYVKNRQMRIIMYRETKEFLSKLL